MASDTWLVVPAGGDSMLKQPANLKKPHLSRREDLLDRYGDFETLAKEAAARMDWQAAANWYSLALQQRSKELALINRLQETLTSKLEMRAAYDLVGDSLRDTFNAQVVMISQYDSLTSQVSHRYATERGNHMHIPGWHPIDTSRAKIVHTCKPLMINSKEMSDLIKAEKMHLIPGTEMPNTWLGVPILVRNEVIGFISLQNLDKEDAFSASDIDLLSTLSNSLGQFLENARLLSDMEKQLAQLVALQETGRAVVSTLDLNALVKLIIEHATTLLQAEGGILNLVDWDRREDEAFACYGTAVKTQGIKVPLDCSLSGWVSLHNQPEISNDVLTDPRAAVQAKQGYFLKPIHNTAIAPLTIKERVIGTLVIIDKLGGQVDFNKDDLELLVGFANQAAIAIENAQLYQTAQHVAVMEERNRLARELHDAVTQTLFSASLIAEALPSAWEKDPVKGTRLLQELRSLSRGALAEMRTLLLELRPAALTETHLEDMLRQLAEAANGREGIPVDVIIDGEGSLPPEVHVAMYRIAQEALSNAIKHARANRISIRLSYGWRDQNESPRASDLCVLLSIIDDGRGFDPSQTPHHGLGLEIMQERAQSSGIRLSIISHPGEGTQITAAWEQAAAAINEEGKKNE